MAIVRAKATIKPILEVLSDGNVHRDDDIQEAVARLLGVTRDERLLRLRNGIPTHKNRTAWGLVYAQDPLYLPNTERWVKKVSTGTIELYEITRAGQRAFEAQLADGL